MQHGSRGYLTIQTEAAGSFIPAAAGHHALIIIPKREKLGQKINWKPYMNARSSLD
jgi:hypothetical protein